MSVGNESESSTTTTTTTSSSESGIGEIGFGVPQIAIDLFVRKKKRKHHLSFTDSFGNILYSAATSDSDSSSNHHKYNHPHSPLLFLFDPSGIPLLSILRSQDGSWEGFKGDGCTQESLFTVHQTLNSSNKIEFNIRQNAENLAFAMRGCLYWRSCTIYLHNSIVAQTSLMYTLGFMKYFVPRSKFRVTVFPGFADYHFIAALIFIFFDGRTQ